MLVKAGDDVEVGTPLFTYDTASLEMDIQQARLDLERADSEMANLQAQIQQLEKEKGCSGRRAVFLYYTDPERSDGSEKERIRQEGKGSGD